MSVSFHLGFILWGSLMPPQNLTQSMILRYFTEDQSDGHHLIPQIIHTCKPSEQFPQTLSSVAVGNLLLLVLI